MGTQQKQPEQAVWSEHPQGQVFNFNGLTAAAHTYFLAFGQTLDRDPEGVLSPPSKATASYDGE